MEMMVVVAMIVFLAAVTMTAVTQYIRRAREMTYKTNAHAQVLAEQDRIVEGYLMSTRDRPGSATTDDALHPDSPTAATQHHGGGGGGGGGGGAPSTQATEATEATEPSESETVTQPPETEATQAPTETEAPAPTAGGVTSKNGYITRGTDGNGVISIDNNADGSQTVKLLYQKWNDGTIKLTRNADGTYNLKMTSSNNYFLGAVIGYSHDFSGGFNLTPSEQNSLANTYGLDFS